MGAAVGASPAENKKGPALEAGTLAAAPGAWELPVGAAEGWRRGPSEGLRAPSPGLELKKSRSDCWFWNRGHWLLPADSLGGAVGAGSVRPKQSSSSSNRQRAGLVLLGPGGTSAWLDKWLRPGAEAWGGGGRVVSFRIRKG